MTSLQHSRGICPRCGNPTDTTSNYCEHCAADLIGFRKQTQQTKDAKQVQQTKQAESETTSPQKQNL